MTTPATGPRFDPIDPVLLHGIDELAGCTEGSGEEEELAAEAFEEAASWTP